MRFFFNRNKHRLVGPTTVKPFTLYWLRRREKDNGFTILRPVPSKSCNFHYLLSQPSVILSRRWKS